MESESSIKAFIQSVFVSMEEELVSSVTEECITLGADTASDIHLFKEEDLIILPLIKQGS